MTNFIDRLFDRLGPVPADRCATCPADDDVSAFLDGALPATQARAIEDHALECSATRAILASIAESDDSPAPAPNPLVRVAACIKGRGLQLLNAAELALRELASNGTPVPALGSLRGGDTATDGLVSVTGPGDGLDALDLQVQSDGTVRLTVSGDLPAARSGEIQAILLEAEGLPREKRPYTGEPVTLGPLEPGARYRVAVVARRPGEDLRSVAEALVDLSS